MLEKNEMAPLSWDYDPVNLNLPPLKIKRDLSCYAQDESEAAIS